jgi:Acetyltransferases
MKLYLPEEAVLVDSNCKIDKLSPSDAEYIYENYEYKQYCNVEYIKERIERGPALGIKKDNKLAAWVMTQDDGAIGLLTVIPEYRRKGLARELMLSMVKCLRNVGQVPFMQIEEDNIPSMTLAMSLGFKKDRRIHWINR